MLNIKPAKMNYQTSSRAMQVYRHIINNYTEYTPFTEQNYDEIFYMLKTKWEKTHPGRGQIKLKITKQYFEKIIYGKEELEESYIEKYSAFAEYHLFHLKLEYEEYEFYVMSENNIFLLIFFKKSIHSKRKN